MSFPIQPENGNIIVKELKHKSVHKIGSLFTGTMANLDFGEVVSGGETKYEAGHIVGYPEASGQGTFINGGIYLIIHSNIITGTWNKKEWEEVYKDDE